MASGLVRDKQTGCDSEQMIHADADGKQQNKRVVAR